MEELIQRYQQLQKAYKRLNYMVRTYKKLNLQHNIKAYTEEENELIVHREALIKRFEICYDLTWKFFKQFLREKHSIEVASPRKVFQACFDQSLITERDVSLLIELIDSRNQTVHVYSEDMAQAIAQQIIENYDFLDGLIQKIATYVPHIQ